MMSRTNNNLPQWLLRRASARKKPALARAGFFLYVSTIKYVFAFCIAQWAAPSWAQELLRVQDGDTIWVIQDGQRQSVRLRNIDAPELDQPYGLQARHELTDILEGEPLRLEAIGHDQYGRILALVYAGETQANSEMVERGAAWVYHHYNEDADLIAIEHQAKHRKAGIWQQPHPTPPWLWRHRQRNR